MKKVTAVLCVLALILAFGACSSKADETTEETTETVTEETTETTEETAEETEDTAEAAEETAEETEEEPKTVYSLSPTIDIENDDAADCTTWATFNISKDIDWDNKTITYEAYDEVMFDMVDINSLKPGDTLCYNDKSIVIDTIETTSEGVEINGGYWGSEGGITLTVPQDSSGIYEIALDDDYVDIYLLGTTTRALSEDVVLTDYQPENGTYVGENGVVVNGRDEVMSYLGEQAVFSPNSTRITLQGGEIIEITRIWVP